MSETESGDLRLRLAILRDELHEELAPLRELRAARRRRREIDSLLHDLDQQLERVRRAAVVTLVGATGAGKSTLLNALAGSNIAEEGVDRPTTRRPVIYAPADADLGSLLDDAVQRPEGYESEGKPSVVRYESAPGPWTTQVLIDAPDLNSVDPQHRAVVTALADRSDVLVVVLHHQSIVEAASATFVDAFAGRRRLVFVLNRIDELTAEAKERLLEQVRDLARTRWNAPDAPVVAVSARAAQTRPDAEGWNDLCRTLHALVRESAIAGVRRLNALGLAGRLQALFRAVYEEVRDDLAALADEAAAGLEELEGRVATELAERLQLRRPDLAELLTAEAARRWDGPGGWALRAGALGTLGLGAGALLLRRSPLLAAGAASGTLVADRVRQSLREQRLSGGEELVPGSTDLAAWYAETMSPARVRAARLASEPEKLGLPSSERSFGDLARAVQDSWNVLLDRDVPAAAERSWLRFFRLPFDLPVYALAGWVLYRVAAGFYEGAYVGVDFLVNASLLLLAYLYAVRTLVRRTLRGRARRLLADATARLGGALSRETRNAADRVRRATVETTRGLERLSDVEQRWRSRLERE